MNGLFSQSNFPAPPAFGLGSGLFGGLGAVGWPGNNLSSQQMWQGSNHYEAMRYAQQQFNQQQAPYPGVPFWGRGGLYHTDENNQKIKHVESREVTCTEIARKQISGAVQAVKDAQDEQT